MNPDNQLKPEAALHKTRDDAQASAQITATTAPISVELGIDGIPSDCCDLILGGMYALKASTSSARFPLFASLLLNAIRTGKRCFLITASKPDEFLSRLDIYWGMSSSALITSGQLKVFSTQAEITTKIFRYGADRFVRELSSYGVTNNAVVLYDQADDLLSLHDEFLALQQVEVLAKWFQSNQITTLLSFSKPNDRQSDAFNTLMDHFTGIAKLGGDRAGLELTFVYWRGSAGIAVARNFSLLAEDEGQYRAVEGHHIQARLGYSPRESVTVINDRRDGLHSDEEAGGITNFCLLYNDPGLDNLLTGVPGTPVRVSSVEEIMATMAQLESAMVLLNTGGIPDLRKTAQVVHTLRQNLTNKIQVVIYGKQPEFSADETQFLMRCGANAVLTVGTVQSNLGQSIASLKRQIFVRAVDPNFEALWERYTNEVSAQTQSQLHMDVKTDEPTKQVPGFDNKMTGYAYSKGRSAPPQEPRSNTKAKRSTFAA